MHAHLRGHVHQAKGKIEDRHRNDATADTHQAGQKAGHQAAGGQGGENRYQVFHNAPYQKNMRPVRNTRPVNNSVITQ